MRRPCNPLVLLLALALLAPLPAAEAADQVLTSGGDVYAVTEGPYGELFPNGDATLGDDPVLAVSVIHPDGTSERLLVPETVGPAAEELASLALGPDGETVHLLWQGGGTGTSLWLGSLDRDGWAGTISVSRGVPVLRGTLRATVTRASAESIEGSEGPARVHRSVLHVLWLEAGTGSVIYAPLSLGDGPYSGGHELFAIDQLVAPGLGEAAPQSAPPAHLLGPVLEPASDAAAAVAAFLLPDDGRLIGVELRMVNSELSRLANTLEAELASLIGGLEPGSPDSLPALAAAARAHVTEAGGALRPALRQLLAGQIESYVLTDGTDWAFQPEAMVERTRARLVEVGNDFDHSSVDRIGGGARPHLINLGQRWEGPQEAHDLSLRVTAVRSAPELPEGVAGSLLLSGDGEGSLVAWEVDGAVFFRESDDETETGWGPVIGLGISGDSEVVPDLLRARVRGH